MSDTELGARAVVFEKKEVLLLLFMLFLLASFAFLMGVHIGKQMAFEKAGFENTDQKQLDLLSVEEEQVKKMDATAPKVMGADKVKERIKKELDDLERERKKKEEMKKIQEQKPKAAPMNTEGAAAEGGGAKEAATAKTTTSFTIQIGLFPRMEDATDYREGMVVRGYNPDISEVRKEGRGVWYQVNLGKFESTQAAKDYISKEKTLFQGMDYAIIPLE